MNTPQPDNRDATHDSAENAWSPRDLKHFRQFLRDRLHERAGDLIDIEAEAANTEARGRFRVALDTIDQGNETEREDVLRTLSNLERREILEILAALDRIDAGTFGICEQTGKRIRRRRLEAIPWTRYTVEAARASETGLPTA